MQLNFNATLTSFLFADVILYLFLIVIDLFATDPIVNKVCKIVLVIVCLIIAFFGSFLIKV